MIGRLFLLLSIGGWLLAPCAMAATQWERGWTLRASGIQVDPATGSPGDSAETDIDSGLGVEVSAGYRYTRRWGLDLGVLWASGLDLSLSWGAPGERLLGNRGFGLTAVIVAPNFQVTPDRGAEVYVGPVAAFVSYGDLSLGADAADEPLTSTPVVPFRFELGSGLALGARVGVDVPLGSRGWMLTGALLYLETDFDGVGSNGREIRLDPLTLGFGAGYRF